MFCPTCKTLLMHKEGKIVCNRCSVGDVPKTIENVEKPVTEESGIKPVRVNSIDELIGNLQSVYIEKWDLAVYISNPRFQPTTQVLGQVWQYKCDQSQIMCYIQLNKARGMPFQLLRKEIGCTKKCRTNWDGYCLFQRVI